MMRAHDLCGCGEHRGTDTQSPFWLELNGEWVHLQGVAPTYPITRERPRSEFISLGGYRYAQQARRAVKSWELSYEYASPEALAALEVAAQFGGVVRLWDEAAAAANAVCPEDVQGSAGTEVLMAGDIPLRAYPMVRVPDIQVVDVSGFNAFYYVMLTTPLGPDPFPSIWVASTDTQLPIRGSLEIPSFSAPPGYSLTGLTLELPITSNVFPGATLGIRNMASLAASSWNTSTSLTTVEAGYPGDVLTVNMTGLIDPSTPTYLGFMNQGLTDMDIRIRAEDVVLKATYTEDNPIPWSTAIPVKPGETFRLSLWTDTAGPLGTFRVGEGGSPQTITGPAGTGSRRYLSAPFTVPEGVDEVLVDLDPPNDEALITGLMLTLGETEPCRFISGQCALSTVSVEDPEHNRSMIPRPGSKGYGDWTVTLKEVCP